MQSGHLPVLRTAFRLLTFRASRNELLSLHNGHLAFGLLCTWLVGMGRAWDDEQAGAMQHLGIGSVIYVFVLSLLLWLTIRPLRAHDTSYRHILTFVCLASPPGFLYAIPVERFFHVEIARNINLAFLGIVATWRVALLAFYLYRVSSLRWFEVMVATLLPLSAIMAPLTILRVMAQTFEAMAGLREEKSMTNPTVDVLNFLGSLSIVAFLPLLCIYGYLVARHRTQPDLEKSGYSSGSKDEAVRHEELNV